MIPKPLGSFVRWFMVICVCGAIGAVANVILFFLAAFLFAGAEGDRYAVHSCRGGVVRQRRLWPTTCLSWLGSQPSRLRPEQPLRPTVQYVRCSALTGQRSP